VYVYVYVHVCGVGDQPRDMTRLPVR
jgi:hypothetical protein